MKDVTSGPNMGSAPSAMIGFDGVLARCARRSAVRRVLIVALLVVFVVTTAGCGHPDEAAPNGGTTTSGSSTVEFVEVYRSPHDTRVWKTWIGGDCVVWMESLGPGSTAPLGYAQTPAYGTSLKHLDLGRSTVQTIPGSVALAPSAPTAEYQVVLPVSWATVLPRSADERLRVVWSLPPGELTADFAFRGLWAWSPEAEAEQLLPESVGLLSPIVSGDTLAIPVTRNDGAQKGGGEDPPAWHDLFMMTMNMTEPVSVDPAAPVLPEAALQGLSPYFTFGTANGSDGQSVDIYDLRDGSRLETMIPPQSGLAIGGHWAAWYELSESSTVINTYSILLMDLESLTTREVTSVSTAGWRPPALAVSDEWLVTLTFEGGTVPASQLQDLLAFHLPEFEQIESRSVLGSEESGDLQISGNRVLLTVYYGLSNTPHDEPEWTALWVADLSR